MQSAYTKYHNTETALICLVNDIQRAIDDHLSSFFFVSLNSFFAIKGALWYVAIATVTFSSVKISCFWAKVVYNNKDYLMLKVNFVLQTFTKQGKKCTKIFIED